MPPSATIHAAVRRSPHPGISREVADVLHHELPTLAVSCEAKPHVVADGVAAQCRLQLWDSSHQLVADRQHAIPLVHPSFASRCALDAVELDRRTPLYDLMASAAFEEGQLQPFPGPGRPGERDLARGFASRMKVSSRLRPCAANLRGGACWLKSPSAPDTGLLSADVNIAGVSGTQRGALAAQCETGLLTMTSKPELSSAIDP